MNHADRGYEIPDDELNFEVGTSSGPGGQNVNRVRTRVTVAFDVAGSPSLSDGERQRIFVSLANRISKEGILKVRSQKHRTQRQNREAARARIEELVAGALHVPTPRVKPKKPPRMAKERRLEEKKRRAGVKKGRARPHVDEG